ncbi:VOC family protein [Fictibacillus fluitans]|uniref:VOC family protein n=1 Tax=Fictibacillus fluitans TaxID=3058422 RepID=A0ABT8HVQ1_9BACL|nr:VOC family protein [Fictibacillus sp. NE201]MDN4524851.1 VOC family protein [Fictibacillus sp. NE201]
MFAFDHLVYFTGRQLEVHMEELKSQSLHPVLGGSHESWGTHNALCYFGLSYVEYLAVKEEKVAQQATENPLIGQLVRDLPHQPGPGQFAIRTDRIEEVKKQFEEQGLKTHLFPGSRKREDGSLLEWKLLFLQHEAGDGTLVPPFFIDWLKPDEVREKELRKSGMIGNHPAGELTMEHLKIIVENSKASSSLWQERLNQPVGESYYDSDLKADCCVLQLKGCELHFCSPASAGSAQRLLEERGERPCQLVLSNGLAI